MRTFVAIKIPVEHSLKTTLRDFKNELPYEEIKWVDFSTLHLTLFFLGETEESELDKIGEAFSRELVGFPKFNITINSFGTFGQKRNPKVIWVGVKPIAQLNELHRTINGVIEPLGFTPDERGFNPHITIGRVKQIKNPELLAELIDEFGDSVYQNTTIDSVILYKSELTPKGPIYTPMVTQHF